MVDRIGIVCNREGARFFNSVPYIDQMFELESLSDNGSRTPRSVELNYDLARRLLQERYDSVIVLSGSERIYAELIHSYSMPSFKIREGNSSRLDLIVGNDPWAFPFLQAEYREQYLARVAFTHDVNVTYPYTHRGYIGRLLMDFLVPLGIESGNVRPEVFSKEEDKRFVDGYLKENGVESGDFLIGLHLGGRNNIWPAGEFSRFIQMMEERFHGQIYGRKIKYFANFTGEELFLYTNLASTLKLLGVDACVIPAHPANDLGTTAEFAGKWSYAVSPETGFAHFLQALDIPGTIIYRDVQWMESWLCDEPGIRVRPVVSRVGDVSRVPAEQVFLETLEGIKFWASR